jgi:hypothetical protein
VQRRLSGAQLALNWSKEVGSTVKNVDIAPISSKDPNNMTIHDLKDDKGVMPYAIDPEAAYRLWELSEKLTGTKS